MSALAPERACPIESSGLLPDAKLSCAQGCHEGKHPPSRSSWGGTLVLIKRDKTRDIFAVSDPLSYALQVKRISGL